VEQAQNDYGVVLGTFPVNSILATVLFDSGASRSFITDQFATKHNLSMSSMKNLLIVSSPGGEMKTSYICLLTVYFGAPSMFITLRFGFDY
jgi:hypothetical protein